MVGRGELELELGELRRRLAERNRTIRELEECVRTKDAIIADKCLLIDRLDHYTPHCGHIDTDSIDEASQSTIQYVDSSERRTTSVEDVKKLMDELEEERHLREKAADHCEQLLKQWDDSLVYAEKVQKQLQTEMRTSSELRDENATLQKMLNERLIITKGGAQVIAILFILLSFYLYSC